MIDVHRESWLLSFSGSFYAEFLSCRRALRTYAVGFLLIGRFELPCG